jgi:hypothetical protein
VAERKRANENAPPSNPSVAQSLKPSGGTWRIVSVRAIVASEILLKPQISVDSLLGSGVSVASGGVVAARPEPAPLRGGRGGARRRRRAAASGGPVAAVAGRAAAWRRRRRQRCRAARGCGAGPCGARRQSAPAAARRAAGGAAAGAAATAGRAAAAPGGARPESAAGAVAALRGVGIGTATVQVTILPATRYVQFRL